MSHSHVERRNETYAFRSLKDLIVYYAEFMPMGKIEQSVRECALFFSARRNATREEERLQFIKRCENAIKADLTILQEAFSRKAPAPAADDAPAKSPASRSAKAAARRP